jgi:hypothetical protein
MLSVTHVHYCKYCDCTFECRTEGCPHFHELKDHACGERQDFIRALRFRLGEECIYRCNKPCSHPPRYRKSFEDDVQFPYMRPKIEPVEVLPSEPVIPGVGKKHSDDCICRKCRQDYQKEVRDNA